MKGAPPGAPPPPPPPTDPGSLEALGAALQGLEHATLSNQVQRAPATVIGVVQVRALQRQEAGNCHAHCQLHASREPRGLQLGGRQKQVRAWPAGSAGAPRPQHPSEVVGMEAEGGAEF